MESKGYDLSWLSPKSLMTWPFKNSEIIGASHLKDTLIKEFEYYGKNFSNGEKTLIFKVGDYSEISLDGFKLEESNESVTILANEPSGLLYGFFHVIRLLQGSEEPNFKMISNPKNSMRMINHWDNFNWENFEGSVERGYAGESLFFEHLKFRKDNDRHSQYAKMLASIGINALTINNVNVDQHATYFITEQYIDDIKHLADIFRAYGIKLFLSINYAAPMEIEKLETADPLDERVREFWKKTASFIYKHIPDFGGFVVKADSENRPGPFSYNRTHAEGANMLGEALEPYGGTVYWRCFVYDNHQDWRNRSTDRARAAYDHFAPMDGEFASNVVLQIKNGPMDFQVREPVSPLFGALRKTKQILEFQITQEYTGQQKHIFYLVPTWKEVLDFDTYADGKGSTVQNVLINYPKETNLNGIVAVVNTGMDENWTGHKLAQVNLYGYGRLIWDSSLTATEIAEEWIDATFNLSEKGRETLLEILLTSPETYEDYTSPLGLGWMVQPGHHYGPSLEGYEYDAWGTYHFSDRNGLGVDRTLSTGTGYTRQYFDENFERYENVENCPDELILFFHHLPYTHVLKSGKTIIQHIYDSHFEGYETVLKYIEQWETLKNEVDDKTYENVKDRLQEQKQSAREWRDQVNTYYYRFSGIQDAKGREIFP